MSEKHQDKAKKTKPIRITSENMAEFLTGIDTVISDCDGVMWTVKGLVPGSFQAMNFLRAQRKKVIFVSNNPLLTEDKFHKFGLDVKPDEVCIPSKCIKHYLRKRNFRGKVIAFGIKAFVEPLRCKEYDVLDIQVPYVDQQPAIVAEINAIRNIDVKAVVCDFDPNLPYLGFLKAAAALQRPECLFIAGSSEMRLTVGDDDAVDFKGPPEILQIISGRKPDLVVGKPGTYMIEYLQEIHNIDLSRTLYIGDQIDTDSKMAYHFRPMKRMLVLSGVFKLEHLETCEPEYVPEYIIESLGKMLPCFPK